MNAATLRYRGYDHVTNGCIASILGATRSLGLSEEQTHQALNLGIAPNIALGQTRGGVLSHWKGCAYANASRNAVFATMLAQRGLTGPAPIFEGEHGFFRAVTQEPYTLETFGGGDIPYKITECSIKRFPLGQYSQTVVQAALEAREKMPAVVVDEIAEVNIRTLQKAIDIMAGDEEKWDPKSRETADHSMPYTTAVALTYGQVHQSHFDEQYYRSRQLLDLTGRVKVAASAEADRRAPEAMLCDVEVVTKSGERYTAEVPYHKGHYKNPMTDAEVEAKFRSLAQDLLSPAQTDALLEKLWNLEEVEDIGEVLQAYTDLGRKEARDRNVGAGFTTRPCCLLDFIQLRQQLIQTALVVQGYTSSLLVKFPQLVISCSITYRVSVQFLYHLTSFIKDAKLHNVVD